MRTTNLTIILSVLALFLVSCEDYLKETPPGELAPDNFLATKAGVESVLFSAYKSYKYGYGNHEQLETIECPTDILYQTGGGMNQYATVLMEFQWTSTESHLNSYWTDPYQSIRDANIVLDNIDNLEDATDEEKQQFISEAKFLRAVAYIRLYKFYGPVPLRTTSLDDPELPRATDEEVRSYIETELEESINGLPAPGEEQYGRATKGAALGFLTRYYMITKQWQKAAEYAQRVMDLNYYELWPDYRTLFNVENEHDKNPANKEMIAISTQTNTDPYGVKIMACALPPNYHYAIKLPEYEWNSSMRNWASNFRLRDAFVDSFDKENDKRFGLIIEEYVNNDGDTVNLRDQVDNSRSMKYFDPNAEVASHGNDVPWIRYADILLMRAEALNEQNGPNQESIDLVNLVRTRAGLEDLELSDFPAKESLRDHIILKERAWEFYSEFMRRDDLIRHGSFISGAQARGKNAQPHHVRYPIPQIEIDGNPNMVQNEGY
jgi:hypothetical protein